MIRCHTPSDVLRHTSLGACLGGFGHSMGLTNQTNVAMISLCLQQLQSSLISLLEAIHSLTHFANLNDKLVALKKVRLIAIHKIAPPALLIVTAPCQGEFSFHPP